jgi:VWFA-related protein
MRGTVRLPAFILATCFTFSLAAHAQQPPSTFRSGVDLIAVDVQVVDKNGAPVGGLTPDHFDVAVDGKRRKVVSAELLRFASTTAPASTPAVLPAVASALPATPAPSSGEGRIYILAVDVMSFKPLEVAPARQAARKFVERLQPNDLAGFVAFPGGQVVDLTTDRARVLEAVDDVIGQGAPKSMNMFGLTPAEVVDISALPPGTPWENIPPQLAIRLAQICEASRDPTCPRLVLPDGRMMARIAEAEVTHRVDAFKAMLGSLAGSPRRKTVVLLSAGMLQADNASGQPQLGDIGRVVGQHAAQANAVVYSLHFDNLFLDVMGAANPTMGRMPMLRDNFVVSSSLHRIAETSGGAFFNIASGGGEYAFDRILTETSSHYLLGVEPTASDRDGRPHQVSVKTSQKNVTLRHRAWVTLPKPATAAPAVAPKPLPSNARPIVDAYEARQYTDAADRLSKIGDLANFIRDFRAADSPWPDAPRRQRVFELELALAALSSRNGFARDEGVKLLTHTQALMERAAASDPIACAWFHTEASALLGRWVPEMAVQFAGRATRVCPNDARLRLAHAVILEQEWRRQRDPARVNDIVAAYRLVPAESDAGFEAAVRAAHVAYQAGFFSQALDALPATVDTSSDQYARYMHGLVKGNLLRADQKFDDAVVAYQRALDVWPGAQSARVSLITLLIRLGRGDEAAALAESIQAAPRGQTDPWWTFPLGDFRDYPQLIANLRALAQ